MIQFIPLEWQPWFRIAGAVIGAIFLWGAQGQKQLAGKAVLGGLGAFIIWFAMLYVPNGTWSWFFGRLWGDFFPTIPTPMLLTNVPWWVKPAFGVASLLSGVAIVLRSFYIWRDPRYLPNEAGLASIVTLGVGTIVLIVGLFTLFSPTF